MNDYCYKLPTFRPRRWVSISSLVNFGRCPRKALYSHGLGLTSGEVMNFFTFGSAIHCGIPHAIQNDPVRAKEAFDEVWDEEQADKKRNQSHGYALLNALSHKHRSGRGEYELIETPPEFQSIEINDPVSPWEVAFALDIGLPIPLVGRIDALVKVPSLDNTICPIDFKTDSLFLTTPERVGETFWLSPQLIGYSIVVDMQIRGEVMPNSWAGVEIFPVKDKKSVDSHVYFHAITEAKKNAFIQWARWKTLEFLSMEKEYISSGDITSFPMDLGNCEAKFSHGANSFPCTYKTLCNLDDPSLGVPLFKVNPEVEFVLAKETPLA